MRNIFEKHLTERVSKFDNLLIKRDGHVISSLERKRKGVMGHHS